VRAGGVIEGTTMRPGATLGRYELVLRLARGVTTEVWLAKSGERGVALKALRLDVPQTPELVRAFSREASIGGKLHHPNIVELLDSGRIAARHYLAMEHVDGMSLAQVGQRRSGGQRLPAGLLAYLLQQVCLGLHHAHELGDENGWLGFVHRDLCPENILVSAGGVAKLIDFGAARMRSVPDGVGPRALRTRYAAPERVQGLSEDRRSDVYSVGVILYEHATGTPPFQGTDLEMISQIVESKPADPRALVSGFPEPLAKIIARAMALNPAERYPHAQALATDLAAFAAAQNRGAELEAALESALRGLFDAPAESEPPWEPQPMPAGPVAVEGPAPSSSGERERFAPDADFSNDDITRPSVVMLPDNTLVGSPEEVEVVIEAKVVAAEASGEIPAWLSERQKALSKAPADIFGPTRRAAGAAFAEDPLAERSEPFPATRPTAAPAAPDVFSLYSRGHGPEPAPPPRPDPPPARRPSSPAAQRFDRGLELLGAKLYQLALAEWEEACRLDPENRLYQSNLKRLRAQIAARVPSHPTESE
jgi:serine/threonine protein kinase